MNANPNLNNQISYKLYQLLDIQAPFNFWLFEQFLRVALTV